MNAESILLVLFELFAKSVLISLAAALLARAWRAATAAQRHLVWLVALVTVMMLPTTRLVTPRWSVPLRPAKAITVSTALPSSPVTSFLDSTSIPDGTTPPSTVSNPPDWRKVLLGIWLGGATLLLGYRLFGSWRLLRLKRRSVRLDDARIRMLLSRVLSELGLRRNPEIRLSEECRVPITWGSLRPVMLLPREALKWNDAWLTAALRHEAAHISRYDYLTRWFAQLACALYWPNPFVWLLTRSLRLAQEQAADDLVLRAGTPPDGYATQLVDAARTVATHGLFTRQAVAMACPSTLEDRVRAIVDGRRDRRPLSRLAATFGSLTIALVLAISTAAQLRSASDEAPPPAIPKAPKGAPAIQNELLVEIESKFVELSTEVTKRVPPVPDKPTIYSDPQFQVIVRTLCQKKGADLLSSPKVATRTNQRAMIEIVQEFSYPTEWEKDGKGWKPTKFETKNVGVTLDVEPRIKEDGAIELHAIPSVVEFLGFVDLDAGNAAPAPKAAPGDSLKIPPVTPGHRSKAIFSEHKREDTVTLKSGETVEIPDLPAISDVKPFERSAHRRRLIVFISPRIINPAPAKEAPKDGAAAAGSGAAVVGSSSGSFPVTPTNPTALETRNTGVTLEVEPVVGPDGHTIDLNLVRQVVEFEGLIYYGSPITSTTTNPSGAAASDGPGASADGLALSKAKKIVIPKIEFREATIAEALDFLRQKAVELDPDKTGVNLVLKPGAAEDTKLTMSLRDVPLLEALRYVASLANLELRAEPNALMLQPPVERAKVEAQPAAAPVAAPSLPPTESAALNKAKKIVIPKLEFREATIAEALDVLRGKGTELEPEESGVNIVLKPGTKTDVRITVSLTNIPLSEALRYVAALAGLELRAEPHALVLQPPGTGGR